MLLDVVPVRLHLIQDIHEVDTSKPSYPWRVLFIGSVARGPLSGGGGARHLVGYRGIVISQKYVLYRSRIEGAVDSEA